MGFCKPIDILYSKTTKNFSLGSFYSCFSFFSFFSFVFLFSPLKQKIQHMSIGSTIFSFLKITILGGILFFLDVFFFFYTGTMFMYQITAVQGTPLTPSFDKIFSAIACYLSLLCLFYFFILDNNQSFFEKMWRAFLLGFLVYAVFETTNKTIFNDWSLRTVIIDTLWGGILFLLTFMIYTLIIYLLDNVNFVILFN
jgi:uncharacterized membrane protein